MHRNMNSVHFSLNGNSHNSLSSTAAKPLGKENLIMMGNLNWLLHKMYLMRDFAFCKDLVEQQMQYHFNQEYLFYIKGMILRDEGQYHEALKCFKRTIDFDSKNASNYKEIGKTLFKLGKYNQSLEIFLKAETHLDSPDYEIYHYIADLLRMNAKNSKGTSMLDAKEYFRRSIMCGKQIHTYRTLAGIYRKEKDYMKAIELLESSLSVSSGNVEILAELGILYLKINEVDRAYERLQEAISIEAKYTNCLLALGAIHQSRNDIDLALNAYKNMPKIQDEGFEIWSNVGLCFYRKNKLIAAISCLKKALWLCPLNYNVLYNLGVILMTAQQFASAFQCFVSAVSLRPDSAESFMMLAICLYYLGDRENSQVAFRKSILSSDAIKNPLIYLNYSIFCLEVIRNAEESQLYLNNFYTLCETMRVPNEYMQIAESVLSKLPSSSLMPETHHTQQLRDTRISAVQGEDNAIKSEEGIESLPESARREDNEDDLV